MNATVIRETEFVTRTIARWGSAAAALIFGVAFLTDHTVSWSMVTVQYAHVVLALAIFAGYALAWSKRFEVLGSVLAVAAIVALFIVGNMHVGYTASPIFLAVGAPALLHLVAVVLHDYVWYRPKSP
jgi:hypothetical protein